MKVNVELYRSNSNIFNEISKTWNEIAERYKSAGVYEIVDDYNIKDLLKKHLNELAAESNNDADNLQTLIRWFLTEHYQNETYNPLWKEFEKTLYNSCYLETEELNSIANKSEEVTTAESLYSHLTLEELTDCIFIENSYPIDAVFVDTLALRELERRAEVKKKEIAPDQDACINWNIANARLCLMAFQHENLEKYTVHLKNMLNKLQVPKEEALTPEQINRKTVIAKFLAEISAARQLEGAAEASLNPSNNISNNSSDTKVPITEIYNKTAKLSYCTKRERNRYSMLAMAAAFLVTAISLLAIASLLLASHGVAIPILAPFGWGLMSLINAKGLVFIFAGLSGLSGLSLLGGIAEIIRPGFTKLCLVAIKGGIKKLFQIIRRKVEPLLKSVAGKISSLLIDLHGQVQYTIAAMYISPFYKKIKADGRGSEPRNYFEYLKDKSIRALLFTVIYPFAYVGVLVVASLLPTAKILIKIMLAGIHAICRFPFWLGERFWEAASKIRDGLKMEQDYFKDTKELSTSSDDERQKLFAPANDSAVIKKFDEFFALIREREGNQTRLNQFIEHFQIHRLFENLNELPSSKKFFITAAVNHFDDYKQKARELKNSKPEKEPGQRFKEVLTILGIDSTGAATPVPVTDEAAKSKLEKIIEQLEEDRSEGRFNQFVKGKDFGKMFGSISTPQLKEDFVNKNFSVYSNEAKALLDSKKPVRTGSRFQRLLTILEGKPIASTPPSPKADTGGAANTASRAIA